MEDVKQQRRIVRVIHVPCVPKGMLPEGPSNTQVTVGQTLMRKKRGDSFTDRVSKGPSFNSI